MELAGKGFWISGDGSVKDIKDMNQYHRRAAAKKVRAHMATLDQTDGEALKACDDKINELEFGLPEPEAEN